MKHYKFDKERGVVDEHGGQAIQLVGGTQKFRKLCGTLVAEQLNAIERGDRVACNCRLSGLDANNPLNCPTCGKPHRK